MEKVIAGFDFPTADEEVSFRVIFSAMVRFRPRVSSWRAFILVRS